MSTPDLSWWDPYSDQPYPLPGYAKPRLGWGNLAEYLKVLGTAAVALPEVAWRYARLKPQPRRIEARDFVGLSVSPQSGLESASEDLVAELGVRELLLRVPVWELDHLDRYLRFVERFPAQRFLINVLQDRESVVDPERWRFALREIVRAFRKYTAYFQIGNAINRSKWGCRHSGEYLRLLQIAEQVRSEFPDIRLVGSSVIDFEPLVTLRTLRQRRGYYLDVVSSLLYVNRRGSPFAPQYKVFDLHHKLRLIYAMVLAGSHNAQRLWITETNWPLLHTQPYTPNSGHPRSTVDEPTQARYLKQYYQIAYQTGWVERVYWWQLINPGYGLVDHRNGLRKHPSFEALREILAGDLYRPPVAEPGDRTKA